jgi:hypothetical protein
MKKILYLLLFFPIFISGQSWQWAKFYGANCTNYNERTNSIFSDGTDYYIVGSYACQLYLPGGSTMWSNGTSDIFISKFDASGNMIWTKSIGGNFNQLTAYEDAYGAYDPVNNCIYIAGQIIGVANFPGGITANADGGSEDVFLGKMDLNGDFSWVKTIGSVGNSGFGNDQARAFVEPDGDVLLVGAIQDTCNFDSFSVPNGGFMARYDKDGNCKWAANKLNGGLNSFWTEAAFIGSDIVLGGSFSASATSIDTITLNSNGSFDGFITRMDSIGNVKWFKKFGNSGYDVVGDLTTDSQNNILFCGGFHDSVRIDGINLASPAHDIFIGKMDESGNLSWLKQCNNNGTNGVGIHILTDSTGSSYVTGFFASNFSLDSYSASSSNTYDMFITRLNPNGICMGLVNFGYAIGASIYIDGSGAIYNTGTFQNTVTIGSTTQGSYDTQDIYVAKLDAITGINNSKFSQSNSLTIYANPNNGTFNIKVPDEVKDFDGAVLLVYDKQGKEVGKFILDEKSADKNHPHFDVTNTAPGTYIVKLIQKGKVFIGQLVLED